MRLKDYIALWLLYSIYLTSLFGFTATAEPAFIDNRYEIIADGSVVRDIITGLEWQRCLVGEVWTGSDCSGSGTQYTWETAIQLNAAGGFVLPDRDQLRTLVYCSNTGEYDSNGDDEHCGEWGSFTSPTINIEAFPTSVLNWMLWSSSNDASLDIYAQLVSFDNGFLYSRNKGAHLFVRLMRTGQLPARLTVQKQGSGTGVVSDSQQRIDCGVTCSSEFTLGSSVNLTATATNGSTFVGWSGCASASGNQCTVTMNLAKQVTASFSALISDDLIDDRYQVIEDGSVIRDVFTGLEWQRCSVGQNWTGSGCSGVASGHNWNSATQLTAPGGFSLPSVEQLRTLVYCSNTGEYDSNGSNANCGVLGSYSSPTINSDAFPNTPDFYFWSSTPFPYNDIDAWDVYFGSGLVSFYPKDSDVNHARLVRSSVSSIFGLTVQKGGQGTGTISSSPAGISCGATCSAEFVQGAVVILTATAESGSNFVSWSGCGSVSANQCTVSISQARTVVAVFQPQQALITVSLSEGGQLLEASINEQGTQAVYELAPNAGFRLSLQVGGSCPAGSWLSSTRYETGVTQGPCTVHFSFTKARRRTLPVWLFTEQD